MLQDRLRLLGGKPLSGNKSVLAKRLLVALVNGETPNALPLAAADYITDERELESEDDEDNNDDDDDDNGEGEAARSKEETL
jgi:hypothetical protein